ncbi:MAG: pyridoxamine 5'-phosphate oxidase family protein [Actinomycetota bacterium]|nr:pyridoxamine 5'-phosphate oxidase family protein [Actinomycetota bacterium]
MNDMSDVERDEFLDEVRVAVLVIERIDKGPLCAPVWYHYAEGVFHISMENDSTKAILLRRAGRASLCIQDESVPYRYVTAEGPVEVEVISGQVRHDLVHRMASRYLGDELGERYADNFPPDLEGGALVNLHPRRWRTEVY